MRSKGNGGRAFIRPCRLAIDFSNSNLFGLLVGLLAGCTKICAKLEQEQEQVGTVECDYSTD